MSSAQTSKDWHEKRFKATASKNGLLKNAPQIKTLRDWYEKRFKATDKKKL